jgi:TusA-related sulfurtransferase
LPVYWFHHETKSLAAGIGGIMSVTVDARGLSCPQPVLMTMNEMKKTGRGQIVVLVDTDTSKENISRSAESQGWATREIVPEGDGYRIILNK